MKEEQKERKEKQTARYTSTQITHTETHRFRVEMRDDRLELLLTKTTAGEVESVQIPALHESLTEWKGILLRLHLIVTNTQLHRGERVGGEHCPEDRLTEIHYTTKVFRRMNVCVCVYVCVGG
jgi:hypothetical protein